MGMLNSTNGTLVVKSATFQTDTSTGSVIDAVNDRAVVDIEDLTHVEIWLNQLVDAGTATLIVEKTVDGTNWALVASKADSDFAAGANKSIVLPLEGSGGMALHAKQVRVTMSAEADGGAYSMTVSGRQLEKFA
jgi:hypothetical protein